jgi:hypothetical protein
MDVLAVIRALKRHWRLTVPIAVLTIAACGYVVLFSSSTYEAASSYVLLPPPQAPTRDEIVANPALGLLHTDNPYARMDQPVLADVLTKQVNSDAARTRLIARGADPSYQVTAGGLYGTIASPTADISATAASPQEAIRTVKMVGKEMEERLITMQDIQGTDRKYMVTAELVDAPTSAHEQTSSRMRSGIAILGLGALLLFLAVSIGEAFENMKRERMARRSKFVLPYAVDPKKQSGRAAKRDLVPAGNGAPPETRGGVPLLGNGSSAPASTNGGTIHTS